MQVVFIGFEYIEDGFAFMFGAYGPCVFLDWFGDPSYPAVALRAVFACMGVAFFHVCCCCTAGCTGAHGVFSFILFTGNRKFIYE